MGRQARRCLPRFNSVLQSAIWRMVEAKRSPVSFRLHPATARSSLKKCLLEFKSNVRRVIASCLPGHSADMFKPCKIAENRLTSIGFSNFVACISGKLHVPLDHNRHIVRQLLSLRTKLSNNRSALLDDNLLKLPMAKVSYRGVPAWRRMKCLSNNLCALAQDALDRQWPTALLHDGPIKSFFIACSVCENSIQAANRTLWQKGRWQSIYCDFCKCSKTARAWKCPCGTPWPACSYHSPMGYRCARACGTKRRAPRGIAAISKRSCTVPPTALGNTNVFGGPRTHDQRIHSIHVSNVSTPSPMAEGAASSSNASLPQRVLHGKRDQALVSASIPKRRRAQTAQQADAIAAINRLREARSILPRGGRGTQP